jgi:para-nitrobenzyl esterase
MEHTNSDARGLIATTTLGKIRGTQVTKDVMRFSHIPYAKPPVGELRFKPTVPAQPWSGVRDGTTHGPSCIQPIDEVEENSLLEQSEDCLWLCIWTRGLDSERRPVMVYIHGGGYIGGGAGAGGYDGTKFAARGDVVLVSIQYRLGLTGWLDLESLGGEAYRHSKNAGQFDQLEALKWIKANCANFGGDPENITIFGESAGGASVLSLMVMPAAKGLFNKVIAQSGTFDYHRTTERCEKTTRRFMEIAKVSSIEEVQVMSKAQLFDMVTALYAEATFWGDWLFGPVYDGETLPEDPYEYIRAGNTSKFRVMHGATANEYHYWLLYFPELMRRHPRRELGTYIKDILDITSEQLDQLYELETRLYPERTESDRYIDLASWMFFRYPHFRLSEAQSQHAPVWQYLFRWVNPNAKEGASHGIEVDFVFHHPESFEGGEPPIQLMDQIQDAWIAFARNGDPNHENLLHWPAYDQSTRPSVVFDKDIGVEQKVDHEMCLAFEALGIRYGF